METILVSYHSPGTSFLFLPTETTEITYGHDFGRQTLKAVPLCLHLYLFFVACNPSLCRAKGRGLQPKGLRVKETADFKVYTKGAGTGELKVSIKGPSESHYKHQWETFYHWQLSTNL